MCSVSICVIHVYFFRFIKDVRKLLIKSGSYKDLQLATSPLEQVKFYHIMGNITSPCYMFVVLVCILTIFLSFAFIGTGCNSINCTHVIITNTNMAASCIPSCLYHSSPAVKQKYLFTDQDPPTLKALSTHTH